MSNITTPDLQPSTPRGGPLYILIPFLAVTLLGILVAMGIYLRRRLRIDELRHRLIPMYSYHPDEKSSDSEEDEEKELTEPLRGEEAVASGKLLFNYSADQ
ncbi:hypothetical protein AAFF_G00097230 [Aldrovandia affinis]|uniref:Small integral membrane protein 29 n=1 Tax=Aldrovandia affinis TaxID=143900 RepID=A0AAD7RVM7_9TELE|nr:hypothetical protein AAFF_G00097230 [Aldrovandia affinis]